MNKRINLALLAAVPLLAASGCSDDMPMETSAMQTDLMQHPPAAAGEHVAVGTVNSIDLEAGTVSISHEAVASAGWPAMTMMFRLSDTALADGIEPGEQIEFHFTIDDGGTITAIEPVSH